MQDGLGRKIEYLRVSVTDRCNLRCRYCMPREGIPQFAHVECLTLEEIYRVISVMAEMGLKKVRFTGGEPTVRKNLVKLVGDVAGLSQIRTVAMTTNGVLFADQVEAFAQAGLKAVNISLDTLDAETFERITGRKELEKVLAAIERSLELGLQVRINCVPVRELNGAENAEGSYLQVAEFARQYPVDVRFIELMPIGCGTEFRGFTGEETFASLEKRYGGAVKIVRRNDRTGETGIDENSGPARYVRFQGFQGRIGFIDPLSHQFCAECNRLRLTVDGKLKLCLYYADGLDLKALIRSGCSDRELRDGIEQAIQKKPKEHRFGKQDDVNHTENAESKIPDEHRMVQIGG